MGGSIFSESILRFTEELDETIDDIDELNGNLKEITAKEADSLRLGLLHMSLEAPSNGYEPNGLIQNTTMYQNPLGVEIDGVEKEFISAEGGRVRLCFFPVKGERWDDKERRLIGILAKTLYMHFGRARMMGIMLRSIFDDPLTGVPNNNALMRFGNLRQYSGQLDGYAAVFINIKNFRYVNMTFGNRQGDILLRMFAQKMHRFMESDEIFARLGGDNFSMLIKKERLDLFTGFMDDMKFNVGEGTGTKQFEIKVRMGIYEACKGDTMADLMNKSSIAINESREGGSKDAERFSNDMFEKVMHKRKVSAIFPQALADCEFVVYYQPKVMLSDNRLCGCEALCRWFRDGKIVPPMEFIPVLEREGSICQLDFYVFEQVCKDIKRWLEMGFDPVRVSVNFSKQHLHSGTPADRIIEIMDSYGIESRLIEIELTEMTGAEDFTSLNNFVARMKERGISTSIDDFGTGYSSLNLLKDLDVDVIKLDKSFFFNIDCGEECHAADRKVVKNIVNMVNELDMQVVSEGIETEAQVDFLKEVNCNVAQGFLYDKPLPREVFEQRMTDRDFYSNVHRSYAQKN